MTDRAVVGEIANAAAVAEAVVATGPAQVAGTAEVVEAVVATGPAQVAAAAAAAGRGEALAEVAEAMCATRFLRC
jgi:hypothetical protein